MVETDNAVTVRTINTELFEQTDTFEGNRTYFSGADFKLLHGNDYLIGFLTTNAIKGLTLTYHYRKIRVPNNTEPFMIPNFFTNVEIGFISQMFIFQKEITEEYIEYDLFFSWSPGGFPTNLDLYIQTNAISRGNNTLEYPTFPNSTDPVNGGARLRSVNENVNVYDSFLVAMPAP